MRPAIYVAAACALCALAPATTRVVLVAAASVLLESLPYLAATALLRPWLGRSAPRLLAYAGCGCAPGPSARSIPAAIACALLFGPWIALGRLALATLTGRRDTPARGTGHRESLADDLAALAPWALLAALLLTTAPLLDLGHRSIALQLVAGAALGLGAAPCAFGTVAIAASLHAQSPVASYALLAAGGTLDVRAWFARPHAHVRAGPLTYGMLALACMLAAALHGAALVHPRLTIPLACGALICAWSARRARVRDDTRAICVAAALLVAIVIGAPVPAYHASETTLADAFAGERVDFTGVYRAQALHAALVRYAITCCRADAHPVVAMLASPLHARDGAWLRVRGTLARRGEALVLVPASVRAVAPPHDPFVYE